MSLFYFIIHIFILYSEYILYSFYICIFYTPISQYRFWRSDSAIFFFYQFSHIMTFPCVFWVLWLWALFIENLSLGIHEGLLRKRVTFVFVRYFEVLPAQICFKLKFPACNFVDHVNSLNLDPNVYMATKSQVTFEILVWDKANLLSVGLTDKNSC